MDYKIQKIKALLKEKNLTYSKFAKLIGKSEPTVRNWFKGTSKIDIDTIEKISKALGVPVSYFFGEEEGQSITGHFSGNRIHMSNIQIDLKEAQSEIKRLEAELAGCREIVKEKEEQIKLLKEMVEMMRKMKNEK